MNVIDLIRKHDVIKIKCNVAKFYYGRHKKEFIAVINLKYTAGTIYLVAFYERHLQAVWFQKRCITAICEN